MVENDYQTVKTALLTALTEWPHMSRPRERAFNVALDALERMQAERNRDYADMREFQARFIEADQERHRLLNVLKDIAIATPPWNEDESFGGMVTWHAFAIQLTRMAQIAVRDS